MKKLLVVYRDNVLFGKYVSKILDLLPKNIEKTEIIFPVGTLGKVMHSEIKKIAENADLQNTILLHDTTCYKSTMFMNGLDCNKWYKHVNLDEIFSQYLENISWPNKSVKSILAEMLKMFGQFKHFIIVLDSLTDHNGDYGREGKMFCEELGTSYGRDDTYKDERKIAELIKNIISENFSSAQTEIIAQHKVADLVSGSTAEDTALIFDRHVDALLKNKFPVTSVILPLSNMYQCLIEAGKFDNDFDISKLYEMCFNYVYFLNDNVAFSYVDLTDNGICGDGDEPTQYSGHIHFSKGISDLKNLYISLCGKSFLEE